MPNRFDQRSDAQLIEAHLAGDAAAWEALFDRYEKFLYRLVLRAGLSRADTEDIFQNVCLKLYLHLEDVREVQRLTGWLGAIVSQEIARWLRRTAATPSVSLDTPVLAELPHGAPHPEEVLLAEERTHVVRQAMEQVGEPCRHLLTMLYGAERLPYTEVAAALDIPLGSVGPRRARCLERLKKIITGSGY
jgi:RNA polymerase sigma factor (sigma-70 family)